MALTCPRQAGCALCEAPPLREAGPGRRPGPGAQCWPLPRGNCVFLCARSTAGGGAGRASTRTQVAILGGLFPLVSAGNRLFGHQTRASPVLAASVYSHRLAQGCLNGNSRTRPLATAQEPVTTGPVSPWSTGQGCEAALEHPLLQEGLTGLRFWAVLGGAAEGEQPHSPGTRRFPSSWPLSEPGPGF